MQRRRKAYQTLEKSRFAQTQATVKLKCLSTSNVVVVARKTETMRKPSTSNSEARSPVYRDSLELSVPSGPSAWCDDTSFGSKLSNRQLLRGGNVQTFNCVNWKSYNTWGFDFTSPCCCFLALLGFPRNPGTDRKECSMDWNSTTLGIVFHAEWHKSCKVRGFCYIVESLSPSPRRLLVLWCKGIRKQSFWEKFQLYCDYF